MSVTNLYSNSGADPEEGTILDVDRLEDEGLWQISLEDGPFSGYPAIKLDRKHLKTLYEVLQQELFPELFSKDTKCGTTRNFHGHPCSTDAKPCENTSPETPTGDVAN